MQALELQFRGSYMTHVGAAESQCSAESKVCCELTLCSLFKGCLSAERNHLLTPVLQPLLTLPPPTWTTLYPNLCLVIHPVLRSTFISARNPLTWAFVRCKFEERA